MRWTDRIALFLSLVAVAATYLVADRVFENLPHIEDEIAYVWQAEAIAGGRLTLPSPPSPKSFLVPFVIDYQGQRFGKYPLGWPAALGVGVFLGLRAWVNPLLAGLGIWLTYRLGQRLFSPVVGLLAAGLTISSPFFLMNSGSLLSHPLGLVLSTGFALSWLGAWEPLNPVDSKTSLRWFATLASAGALGLLTLTRPLTAVGVAMPFVFHSIYVWLRGTGLERRRLLVFGLVVLALSGLHFLWQYAVTGDATLNPYTLWWDYDKVGFGPGVGRVVNGHTLNQAWINTRFSLWVGQHDLFGWGRFSWIFLPFGVWGILKYRRHAAWTAVAVFPSLVVIYLAYWIGSSLFGPRYYYEGLFSLTLLSAAGIAFVAGWSLHPGQVCVPQSGWGKLRPFGMVALLVVLFGLNAGFYTPIRVGGMYGLYGITRARLAPFQTVEARALTPALVVVHPDHWTEYGVLLNLQDPFLETPFIFVISRGSRADAAVIAAFPERTPLAYYPDEPYTLLRLDSPGD